MKKEKEEMKRVESMLESMARATKLAEEIVHSLAEKDVSHQDAEWTAAVLAVGIFSMRFGDKCVSTASEMMKLIYMMQKDSKE